MFYLSNYSTVTHLFYFIAQDFFLKIKGFCSPVIFLFIAFSLFPMLASVMWTLGCQSPVCYLSDIFLQVFLAYHCMPSLPFLSHGLHILILSLSTELFHLSRKQLIPLTKNRHQWQFLIYWFLICQENALVQVKWYSFSCFILFIFFCFQINRFFFQIEGVECKM